MDRDTWMYTIDRYTADYMKGLSEFMKCAEDHRERMRETKISCPCKECRNIVSFADPNMIRRHLIEHGFDKNYTCWDLHGEPREPQVDSHTFVSDTNHEENDSNDDNHPDNLDEMLHDAEINVDEKNVKKLQQLFVEAEKALYNGCKKFTKLSFVLKLLDLKAKNNWSDKSFTTLLELLHEAFPEDNELPVSTYQAKKLTCPMGLEVQRIHACPNDCILYRKAYKDLHECPVCMESRYKHKNLTELDSDVTKNGPPAKMLWYLPIIPRLKKLYANPKDAKLLRWHAEERKNDGKMRHVADSPQWKNIDRPKQPGNDIDVYLRPLIDDMIDLWEKGVEIYDAYKKESFQSFTCTLIFKLRAQASERGKKHISRPRLGPKGYRGFEKQWQEERNNPDKATELHLIPDICGRNYRLARAPRDKNGIKTLPLELINVSNNLVQATRELAQGSNESKTGVDPLILVLGPEHGGRTRGVGCDIGYKKGIEGYVRKKRTYEQRKDIEEIRNEVRQQMKEELKSSDFWEEMRAELKAELRNEMQPEQNLKQASNRNGVVIFTKAMEGNHNSVPDEVQSVSSDQKHHEGKEQQGTADERGQSLARAESAADFFEPRYYALTQGDEIPKEFQSLYGDIFGPRRGGSCYVVLGYLFYWAINATDIIELLTNKELECGILTLFEMSLYHLKGHSSQNKVGFLNPGMITTDSCFYEKWATIDYLTQSLTGYDFYLAPYLQGRHYVLFIICPKHGMGFILNSSKGSNTNEQSYRLAGLVESVIGSLKWEFPLMNRQPEDWECGYYVMKWMHDFILKYFSNVAPWSNERPLENKELNAIIGSWFTLWRD
ncbi:hypothetical protein Tco_1015181 [Tanacetum coccineum]|uniref:Transposase-associated domain-containing protein n=1 Tax=Tanacetum coccineum TaxID=301880 RepID=A0ABQ5FK67_9ASTR